MAIEITVPRLGWAMEEGIFAGWLKQEGEAVKAGDPLFALEGDKALQEVESNDSGILRIPSDSPKNGDSVKVGQLLGHLLSPGETPPNIPSPVPAAEAGTKTPAATAPVTPRARRLAAALGVDAATLAGSGHGGRIRERDVRAAASPPKSVAPASVPESASVLPIMALRRTIAERMVRSRDHTAPVTLTLRADAANLVALRRQFKKAGATPVPSYTDIIAKLAALALRRHPVMAARWEDSSLTMPKAIHIGLAVDTEWGLLVPVLRDIDRLFLPEIARQSAALIAAARSRRLAPDQLAGGVFTVTNLGAFGVEAFTPIINYPETAILGVGAIRPEAVIAEGGAVRAGEQVTLSLSFDHRVVDGAPAARFLQTLVSNVENPSACLLAG